MIKKIIRVIGLLLLKFATLCNKFHFIHPQQTHHVINSSFTKNNLTNQYMLPSLLVILLLLLWSKILTQLFTSIIFHHINVCNKNLSHKWVEKFKLNNFKSKMNMALIIFIYFFIIWIWNPKLVDVLVLLLKCYCSCTIIFNVLFYVCFCIVITILLLLLLYWC